MLIPELELQALRFLNRNELEGLQIHSRYLRNLVDSHAKTLPLRHIHEVYLAYGAVYLRQAEESVIGVVEAAVEDNMEALFRRVSGAFIGRLVLTDEERNLVFPRYLQAHADALHCRIQTLRIDCSELAVDNALMDFIGAHLEPQRYEAFLEHAHTEEQVMLFTRTSFRDNLKHLFYDIDAYARAPAALIPELFRADTLETCDITLQVNPCAWVAEYVKAFKTLPRGSKHMCPVAIVLDRFAREELHESPTSEWIRIAKELFGPTHGDRVPTPDCAFVRKWVRNVQNCQFTTKESDTAERFIFTNRMAAKHLHFYVWQLEHSASNVKYVSHAYLLTVTDI